MEGTFLWPSLWNGGRGKKTHLWLKQPPKTALINRLHAPETKPDIPFLFGSTTLPGFNLLRMQPDWLEQRGVAVLADEDLEDNSLHLLAFRCHAFAETKQEGGGDICSTSIFLGQTPLGNVGCIAIPFSAPDSTSCYLQKKKIPEGLFSFKYFLGGNF